MLAAPTRRATVLALLLSLLTSALVALSATPASAYYLYSRSYTVNGQTYTLYVRSITKNGGADDSGIIDVCGTRVSGPRNNNCLKFQSTFNYGDFATTLVALESGWWDGEAIYQNQSVRMDGKNGTVESPDYSGYTVASEYELPWTTMSWQYGKLTSSGEPYLKFTLPEAVPFGDGGIRQRWVYKWGNDDQWSKAWEIQGAMEAARGDYWAVAANLGTGLGWMGLVAMAAKYRGFGLNGGVVVGTSIMTAMLPIFFFAKDALTTAWSYYDNLVRAGRIYDTALDNQPIYDEF